MKIALRTLARELRFSTFVVLVLAVGIGATTTVFTVVNHVLLRGMPFTEPDRLVWIWSTRTDRDKAFFSIPNFVDTRRQVRTLADMAAFSNWSANLIGSGDAERLQGVRVTGNAFQMLGTKSAAGRLIGASDAAPGADRVVVISSGVWQRRFGQRTDVIGSKILLNGEAYTLIGVLAADSVFPGAEADIAGALDLETDPRRSERGSNFLRVFGRLADTATVQQASAELSGITDRLRLDYPADNAKHTAPRVLYLADEIVGGYKRTLWMLFAAVALVLAIACANVANLIATRAAMRQRDMAIRTALGASRSRIFQELLMESGLLSGAGGALGLVFAWWVVRGVATFFPAAIPRISSATLDFTALIFAVVLSSTVVLALTLPLLWSKRRSNLYDVMKRRASPQAKVGGVPHRGLVIVEVALSTILMISAGLLGRSFIRLQATDSGIRPDHLLTTRLSLPPARFTEPASLVRFGAELTDELQQIEGAKEVGLVSALPLSGINSRTDFIVAGRAPAKLEDTPAAQTRWVSSNYFTTVGIPIRQGRSFEKFDTEHSEPVVIIDSALANRFMNGLSPLEQSVSVDFGDRRPARTLKVVGVVGDVKHFALDDPPAPTLYFVIDQVRPGQLSVLTAGINLVIKTAGAPLSIADDARRAVSSIDPHVAASAASTVDQLLQGTVAPRRFTATVFEIFAAAGLVLALMGLYAVLSYAVVRRRYEIGLRVAFGAKRWQIIGLIVGDGMKVTLIGCVFGLSALAASGSAMEPLLFDTNLVDPKTYVSMLLLLFVVSALASYLPARRAAAADPMVSLRNE